MKTNAYLIALCICLSSVAYASPKSQTSQKKSTTRVTASTAPAKPKTAAVKTKAPARSASARRPGRKAPVAKKKTPASAAASVRSTAPKASPRKVPPRETAAVTPRGPRPYQVIDAQTCASLAGPTRTRDYRCVEETNSFLAGETVHFWAKLENVSAAYQYQLRTYRDGKLVKETRSAWNKKSDRPVSSYLVSKDADTLPGNYRTDFLINVGSGFEKIASREYEVEVLSPVEGEVRAQCYWPSEEDAWAFCPHVKTGRRSSRGIALANDTAAWDVNMRDYSDAGKVVYPVAPGKVVRYGDQTLPGDGEFAGVLIEHRTPSGERWWSGYLHMKRDSIRLQVGQDIDIDQPIGRVGRTGTSNSHLHLVVYKGKNKLGALQSFNADFRSRTYSEMQRVARQRALNPDQG